VSLLLRNRILLLGSVILLNAAIALTMSVLRPDGLVRARELDWGPLAKPAPSPIAGYASDREGGECGVSFGEGRAPLPGCHAYLAPEVVRLAGRTLVVWEHRGANVSVSEVGPDLGVIDTIHLPRPRTRNGVLLPRTGVGVDGERIAIRYQGGDVVTVGADLRPWPGGAPEVASARLGARGVLLIGGALLLLTLYFMAAGWALALPTGLARRQRDGGCVEVDLSERGSSAVLDGQAIDLDLERAAIFGAGSERVTLVLDARAAHGNAYRELGRLSPVQVWSGTFADAMIRARAIRTGAVAVGVFSASLLTLAFDAYLVW
jgi:hypothetical protein